MTEATQYEMPHQLRYLFALLCLFADPIEPRQLFFKHKEALSEDFMHKGLDIIQHIRIVYKELIKFSYRLECQMTILHYLNYIAIL